MVRHCASLALVVATLFEPAQATRQPEALERFEVSSLRYWHYVESPCGATALILDADGFSYQLREGSYLGKNHGRVSKVTPSVIEFTELYEDAQGNWYEKSESMQRSKRGLKEAESAGAKVGGS